MKAMLIPVVLGLAGLGAGAGAGLALRPAASADDPATGGDGHGTPSAAAPPVAVPGGHGATPGADYVRLSNQFVVPVVEGGRVASMVILSLTLEVVPGSTETVYSREPKLRDAFLQVLFDHANSGGFRGTFTDGANLILLRAALREMAAKVLGPVATDVLIADIVRQDQ